MRGKRRRKLLEAKRQRKAHQVKNPGFTSRYARKKIYLNRIGLFGFDVPEPKPWR
jgi:hypothetical protein